MFLSFGGCKCSYWFTQGSTPGPDAEPSHLNRLPPMRAIPYPLCELNTDLLTAVISLCSLCSLAKTFGIIHYSLS